MKLLVDGEVFSWWARGGIRSVYSQILPRVQKLAPDWDLRIAIQGRPQECVKELVCSVEHIPSIPVDWHPWRVWSRVRPSVNSYLARRYWSRSTMDVFHPTYYREPPKGVRSFTFVYDMIIELFPEWFQDSYSQSTLHKKEHCIKRADLVLCISENTRRDVVRLLRIPEEKCRVVYLGGLKDSCREVSKVAYPSPSHPFLLYVGDFGAPYKNFLFLLNCLGSAECRSFRDLNLVVVSSRSPSAEESCDFEQRIGTGRLIFIKGCSDQELVGYYKTCAGLVYPSLYEGFGIPILEALEMGAPVICSHASSLPEVGGEAVNFFDPKSPDAFRAALGRAISEGRGDVAVARRQTQASRFSWDQSARHFVEAAADLHR